MNRTDIFDNDRLQRLMGDHSLDLLLLSSRHNIRYITGGYFFPLFVWDTHTRETQYLPLIGIPSGATDKAFLIGRPWETSAARESDVWIPEILETSSIGIGPAVAAAVGQVKERGLSRGRIGLELTDLPAEAYITLRDALPNATLVDATELMDIQRAAKTEREIEIIRQGTILNLAGVNDGLASAAPGMATLEVADTVKRGFENDGLHFLYALVCAGPSFFRVASPKRKVQAGRILHIDSGALNRGYVAETCRTGHVGDPTPEADKMLGLCTALEKHMLPFLRPGARAADIQSEADGFIESLGVPFSGKFIAHGIGMVHHEKPVVNLSSSEALEAGMVLSLEMEFKTETTGHVKTEDMVVIRPNECEILSPGGESWTISKSAG